MKLKSGVYPLCVLFAACATAPRPSEEPLPYHVAFEAVRNPQVEDTYAEDGMRLELDAEALDYLNRSLEEVFAQRSFADVTRLDTPGLEEAVDGELLSIRSAREDTDANLLITFELRYGTAIYHEISPFRINISPWWVLPGPQLWWAQDHAYSADVTLTVKLFDLARCDGGEADRPLELRRWFFSHALSLDEVYLDFIDRAGLRWEQYLLSMVVPSTALALSHPDLEKDLRKHFIDSLTRSLAFEIERKKRLLVRNEQNYGFYLEPTQLLAERLNQEEARVVFSLDHRIGRTVNEPAGLQLFAADAEEVPAFETLSLAALIAAERPHPERADHVRYVFERIVPIGPETSTLRLNVVAAGGAQDVIREFTIRLMTPEPEEEVE